jgi:hypothetical protein
MQIAQLEDEINSIQTKYEELLGDKDSEVIKAKTDMMNDKNKL